MGKIYKSPCGRIELREGRWQDVLADVEQVDAVITDPPYSQRSEDGFRSGSTMKDLQNAPGMGYEPITKEWCNDAFGAWSTLARSWLFVFGDHVSFRWWETASQETGRYTFPPVVIAKTGAAPRMSCDGPGSHCEYALASRPKQKRFLKWGSLPGWYPMQTVRHVHGSNGVSGAKSIDVMRAIVRDYSRAGDIICDPCAGSGTTLLAAAIEGRRAIGAEMDPKTYDLAVKRFRVGYTTVLF